MNWLFRWLDKKIAQTNLRNVDYTRTVSGFDNTLSGGMSFTIHRASGGFVVEHSHYDEKLDKNNQSLHIITDDADLGESLAHIVTIETLRR